MRPIATAQDYVRTPLNELLGAPANVRLLRVLAEEISEPIGAPDAAAHTGLTETGARRALKRLARTGFVEQIGGGRAQRFRLRDSDPLSAQLIALFHAERERHQTLLSRLKKALSAFSELKIAWIDDPPTDVGQPLHLGLVADSQSLRYLSDQLRQRIVEIEADFDLTIELHAFSRADAPDVRWETTTILAGHPVPAEPQEVPHSGTHSQRITRAERASAAIAEMLDRDPSLLRRAQRHLDLLLREDQGAASHDLREWQEILIHYSKQRLKDFLVADTPRAQRLRQSSPFFAVLTPQERDELLRVAGATNDS